jgi:hypothetical protein
MAFPLLPVAIVALTGLAWRAKKKRDDEAGPLYGQLTGDRQVVYETAMNSVQEPEKLRALAAAYDNQGLHAHADMLRKRAKLRSDPQEKKNARAEVFRKAMSVKDPAKKEQLRQLADAFHGEGAIGAAEDIRRYAESL